MDEGKKKRLKRIAAGIFAVLFILLILNITIWQFYLTFSIGTYVIVIMLYLFVFNRKTRVNGDEKESNDE